MITLPPTNPLDVIMGALCLLREAEGESILAKAGVWEVIVNRVEDSQKRFRDSIHRVVVQPGQFSSFSSGNPRAGTWPNEGLPQQWLAWLDCLTVVGYPIPGSTTKGANYYHDVSIQPPYLQWLGPGATLQELIDKQTAQIGRLLFYKL
jgi:hypothetical protein